VYTPARKLLLASIKQVMGGVVEFEVLVQLKKEVLDPEGRAIKETLTRLGFDGVKQVTVSKRFLIEIDSNSQNPETLVQEIANEFLANPVSQTLQVKRLS
jgi:phosphoribosylformylglycinamidine synthase subunit PurS